MNCPSFDIIAKTQFKFLELDFDFQLTKCCEHNWGYEMIYLNNKVGIKITYEFGEAYIFILLYKLIDGKLIENPHIIKNDTLLYGYGLDDIINLRNPSALIKPAYQYGSKSEYYDKEKGLTLYVSAFADNLKKYATDILNGNFEIFIATDKVVKERANKYQ